MCDYLGEAYYYAARPITDDDIVRVEAADMAGNVVKREIHIGSGVGGAITDDLPNLQITVDKLSEVVNPDQAAIFKFSLTNAGGTTGHPLVSIDDETVTRLEGWEFTWTPVHKQVDPGATTEQELAVRPPSDVTLGSYLVNATFVYERGAEKKAQTWGLTIHVGNAPAAGTGTNGPDGEGNKESPALGPVTGLALLAVAVVLRRRA